MLVEYTQYKEKKMNIGTLKVSKMNDSEVIFENTINNVTISNGRIFIQLNGTFFPNLPFQKTCIYNVMLEGIEGMDNTSILTTYEDYIFNAGSTEQIDMNGNRIAGVCVLSNQLQFLIVG